MNYPSNMFQTGPARIKDLVSRQRLEPIGRRMLEYQATTVVAPAGYGKTVWVSSLLDSPGWPDAAWISLDRQDAEPSVLLCHLIQSVNGSRQGSEAWRTLMSLENIEKEWFIAAAAFLGELARDRQMMLVLDDAHFLYDSRLAVSIVDFILARLPDNIHIVFIARSTPPFKLYRQEINNQLLQIGSRELVFLEEEARALFSNMKLELSDGDVSALYACTEGWAVGLRLLGIYLKQPGSSLQEALRSLRQEGSGFNLYVMNEFLTRMPAGLQEFLLDASFLPYLEVRLCDAAFARHDSGAMLEILRGYGLLSPFDNDKGFWRMHYLLGDWLKDIAARQRTREYADGIRERAASFFERNGDVNRAVDQCFLSGRWDTAARLIHEHGYEYFSSGFRMDILYKWIERLPEELVENDCWLLYFKGMSILNVDDPRAFQLLSSAVDIAVKTGDIKCEAEAIWGMLLPAIFSGDVKKGELAGSRLRSHPELMTNPASRKEALAAALQYAMTRDSLQEGIELSRQALKLELPPEMSLWVRYATGYLYMRVGRLREARQLMEETLKMPYVTENERRIIVGYEVLMDIIFVIGDFRALDEVCRTCLELCEKYGMPGIMGRVYYLKAQCRYREGQLTEARRFFDLAYEHFTSAGVVHFANQAAIDILLLRIGNGENAEALLRQIMELMARFASVPYGLGIDYMVNTSAGIAALEAGKTDLAGQMLERSARRWREVGARISLAATNLLLARLSLMRGDEQTCDDLLREALGEAEAWQWENFWEWDPSTVFSMCQRAVDRDIHPHWAARLLRRWFPERSRREFSLMLVSPKPQLQALAADFFRQDFNATGKAALSVFFLGGFRLFVNGLEIEESSWKTKKAEDLFKRVVADRHASDKEYLMQQLWPDGDAGSNDGKLRMTLSYVRKALAAAGLSSECVVMRRGEISLDPGYEITCDYKEFMQKARAALSYARANHPCAVAALEQAARAYTGEFLPEDLYEDFAEGLRGELRSLLLEVLAKLALLQFARADLAAALQACTRYLAQEPVDETIIRMAMNILCAMNRKHKAMELYRNLKIMLAREYNTAPEQETAALYRKMQGGAEP